MKKVFSVAALLLVSCARNRLPVLGTAPDFTLTGQNGQPFSSASLRGHVWVADFIFTTCTGPCPLMSARMRKIQEAVRDLPGVKLVSFTVDPQTDTPEVLASYAARYQARPGRWYFLTGPQGAPKFAAIDGGASGHSTRFVLLDRQSRIRGYFSSSAPPEDLLSAIRLLQNKSVSLN